MWKIGKNKWSGGLKGDLKNNCKCKGNGFPFFEHPILFPWNITNKIEIIIKWPPNVLWLLMGG